ncbi:MAG: translocation/assembly module TamB domain-containing protein [Bacteroidetes bacterium]|nr:translocation/assembly module TamB domain-containing protein [Bacteroidota bacterium]
MMRIKREKVVKIIKKTGKIIAWFFAVIFVLLIGAYFALKSPACQTWLANKAANYLSKELKTKVSVKSVDIEFFTSAVLKGIYVEDQHGDTLLYASELKAGIHTFSWNDKYLSIDAIDLTDATVKIKKYKGEHGLSYRFIQKYFQGNDTTTKSGNAPWKVELGGIGLHNVTVAYIDTRWNDKDRGMDYDDIRVTGINADFSNIDPMGDSLRVRVVNMEAKEKCGLTLETFSSLVTVGDTFARFDNLKFSTRNGSDVDGFLCFTFASTDDVADDFVHKVKMDNHFSESIVEMADIAYFSPDLIGMRKKILLTGDMKGTVEHLRCKNVDLRFGEISRVAGNFSFDGLPDINETDMDFKVKFAKSNKKDLEGIPLAPWGKKDHISMPSSFSSLGEITFTGTYEGFLNDFVAKGTLGSAIGSLSLDNLAMMDAADSNVVSYNGAVSAQQFNIGTLFGSKDVGHITGQVTIKGSGLPEGPDSTGKIPADGKMNAMLSGNFSQIEYNGYSYSGVSVDSGTLRNNYFDGDLTVNDPNVKMTFDGSADLSGKMPVLNFKSNISNANLGELNFFDKDHEYLLSCDMVMNLTGDNIDNVNGTVLVNGMNYSKDGEAFKFNSLWFIAGPDPEGRRLNLQSDVASASVWGDFELLQLPDAVSDLMSQYLPAYFPVPDAKQHDKDANQQFKWNITIGKSSKLIEAFVPGLEISPNTNFRGSFDKKSESVDATIDSQDGVTFNDISYENFHFTAGNSISKNYIQVQGSSSRIQLNDTMGIDNFATTFDASDNKVLAKFEWKNNSKMLNDGLIISQLQFENQKQVSLTFNKADIHVNDSAWSVYSINNIRFDSSLITFKNLVFNSGDQSIGFNGMISHKQSDELNISLKNFNISYLNYFTKPNDVTLSGFITSESAVSDLYNTPIFTSNSDFHTLKINDQKIGDGEVDAVWENAKNAVYLHGHFTKGIIDDITNKAIDNIIFDGFYYPSKKENSIDINSSFTGMELGILAPLLKDYCSMMKGQFGGELHLTGTPSKPLLNGKMDVSVRRAIVDYLGLSLAAFTQPVYIEENSFFFDDFKVTDEHSDTAKIYGHLFHDNFKNFQFDMDFSFDHFMVLNTTEEQNELYYGKVFATGYMNVFGYVNDKVSIDMKVQTDKIKSGRDFIPSEFNIPMTSTSEVSSNDFIVFEDHHDTTSQKKPRFNSSGIDFSLEVVATDDANVNVVFDKTVGDELKANGNGDIQMHVYPSGEFTMFGDYRVSKGKYLFTMKNVVYVPFDLASGGTISWNGDPYEAIINADAVYRATASVEPFFPMDSTNQAYHRSYPVDVIMHLNDRLMNPRVGFDISLPTADQTIQETVRSYTQSDLEKNRQVLSLMVLNSFMTPGELREGTNAANNTSAGSAGTTLLSNFVSGTLNNWLSQISSDINMGVKYRPNDDMTTQELKVYLGTQLMNNKITIDANAGKVNASQATGTAVGATQWVGDVNIEYKVTDDGKVRLRAFNRTNDANVNANANSPYTQGVGIFYKEDFDSWAELKQRYHDSIHRKKTKTTQ